MFSVNGIEKPVIIMPQGLKFSDLCLILDFAYLGQAQVPHDSLDNFLKAGELLQIRGIKERRLNFITQQTTMNRSFDATISSTQETFTPQPPAKRPRDDDEISIQEASEIMKMLLESNPDLEGEVQLNQEKTATDSPAPIPIPMSNNTNFLPKTPMMQAPQVNFYTRPPIIPAMPTKKKGTAVKSLSKEKYPCRYCHRELASKGRVEKHENECNDNPNREIMICDICKQEVKPSAMTLHKNKHGPPKQQNTSPDSNQLPVISSPLPRIYSSPIMNVSSPAIVNIGSPGIINTSSFPSPVDPLMASPQTSPTGNVIGFNTSSPMQSIKEEAKRDDEKLELKKDEVMLKIPQ